MNFFILAFAVMFSVIFICSYQPKMASGRQISKFLIFPHRIYQLMKMKETSFKNSRIDLQTYEFSLLNPAIQLVC